MRNLVLAFCALVLFGAQPAAADKVDDLLAELFESDNAIAQIVKDFPVEQAGAEARLRAAFETGRDEVAVLAGHSLGKDLGAKYRTHYMARTTDEAVMGFLQMQIDSTNELATIDGSICFGWAFGTASEPAPFSEATTQIQGDAFTAIVMNKGDNPRQMDTAEFEAASQKIGATMGLHFNAEHLYFDGLTNPASVTTPEDMRKTCLTWWGYLAAIKLLPGGDAAAYFRTMMTAE